MRAHVRSGRLGAGRGLRRAARLLLPAPVAVGVAWWRVGATSAVTVDVPGGEIVVQTAGVSLPNDPQRCIALAFIEFSPIADNVSSTAQVEDTILPRTPPGRSSRRRAGPSRAART